MRTFWTLFCCWPLSVCALRAAVYPIFGRFCPGAERNAVGIFAAHRCRCGHKSWTHSYFVINAKTVYIDGYRMHGPRCERRRPSHWANRKWWWALNNPSFFILWHNFLGFIFEWSYSFPCCCLSVSQSRFFYLRNFDGTISNFIAKMFTVRRFTFWI